MRDVREVMRLYRDGAVPMREIARMTGVARSTVRDMILRFERSGLFWPVPREITAAALELRLYGAAGVKPGRRKLPEPDWSVVAREMKRKHVTLQVLWEEYIAEHPDGYLPRAVSDTDLAVMRRIDELHLLYPFAGSRMLRDLLRQEGTTVGRLHVATLMKRMGLEALYRRPNTSKPAPGHKIYPYLLRKLAVTRPNQVWATDITYVPMARGFVYLVAIVDWFTRRVLAWRVSISLDAEFCIEALEEALMRSPPRKISTVRTVKRASTSRRAKRQGTE